MSTSPETVSGQGRHTPLDNITYDLIASIYEKSKGLEALKQYLQDAQGDQQVLQIFQQIQQQDQKCVRDLQQALQQQLSKSQSSTSGSSR
jgi:gamma-glutamyl:cysteine ligase YbdK (ATP-grasp superfamily)